MSDLEKILNDDLLKCKIVESVENPVRRVDLIKWTHDNTYSIAEVRKDTGKLEVTDLKAASGLEAYKQFLQKLWRHCHMWLKLPTSSWGTIMNH